MAPTRTQSLLRSALVAALVAVGALIAIPIGPVPITLQVLVVAVATLALSPAEAAAALALYVMLGMFGAPVFAGGAAGPGVILGPTGGFIAGFVIGAPAGAMVRRATAKRGGKPHALAADVAALVVLLVCVYAAGWAWFAVTSGRTAGEAFALTVAPFVAIDAGKAAAALVVSRALRSAGIGDRPSRA